MALIKPLFNMGYNSGKQAEYDLFWDAIQANGNRQNYMLCFWASAWTDKAYQPKYNIVISLGSGCEQVFAWNYSITDTKVPIIVESAGTGSNMFNNAQKLVTIRKLKLIGAREFTSWFTNCYALKNITVEGTIQKSINFSWSPLTIESMKSIISCLTNYTNTDYENKYTIKFSSNCWSKLNAETPPIGYTDWEEYVTVGLKWLV